MNFNNIIKRNRENIRSIIKLITNEENQDLEQEVYVKVWKNADKYKEQGSFSGWINTIAKNISKDYLKSAVKRREQLIAEDDTLLLNLKDKKSTPELKLIRNDRQKRIIKAINNLKPKFRQVIMYCEINGYTYEECAQRLKCPVGTVKSRIYNAKKQLAVELKDLL